MLLPHESRGARMLLALFMGALLAGCGPTQEEVAASVIFASPLALATAIGALAILYAMERQPLPRWRLLPALIGGGATLVLAIVVATLPSGDEGGRWFGVAIYLFSASYLTLVLVLWSILYVAGEPRLAYTWSWLPPLVLMLAPAVVIVGGTPLGDWVDDLWIGPGWFGAITLPLFALLLVVQILRARNALPAADDDARRR